MIALYPFNHTLEGDEIAENLVPKRKNIFTMFLQKCFNLVFITVQQKGQIAGKVLGVNCCYQLYGSTDPASQECGSISTFSLRLS